MLIICETCFANDVAVQRVHHHRAQCVCARYHIQGVFLFHLANIMIWQLSFLHVFKNAFISIRSFSLRTRSETWSSILSYYINTNTSCWKLPMFTRDECRWLKKTYLLLMTCTSEWNIQPERARNTGNKSAGQLDSSIIIRLHFVLVQWR